MENNNLKLMPEILIQPAIPPPLYGINPRILKGAAWWDKARANAYASTGYCCIACGVHKSNALYHQWLEAHESFKMDYKNFIAEVVAIVPLCHACHNYIHRGRLGIMLSKGLIDKTRHSEIISHGLAVIKAAGLNPMPTEGVQRTRKEFAALKKRYEAVGGWRLLLDGVLYPGKTNAQLCKDYR